MLELTYQIIGTCGNIFLHSHISNTGVKKYNAWRSTSTYMGATVKTRPT